MYTKFSAKVRTVHVISLERFLYIVDTACRAAFECYTLNTEHLFFFTSNLIFAYLATTIYVVEKNTYNIKPSFSLRLV